MKRIWKQTSCSLPVALLLTWLVSGQAPPKPQADEKLAFEVASVKPNKTDAPARGNFPSFGLPEV
jgi:hypothetical protein